MDIKYLKELYEDEYDVKVTLKIFSEWIQDTIEQLIRDQEF